jgi:hypothetical protein
MEYYYQKLSSAGKSFYRRLLSAIAERKSHVSGSPLLTKDTFAATVQAVNYDHPELFYVNFQKQSYLHDYRGYTLQLEYLYPPAAAEALKQQIDARADAIIKAIGVDRMRPSYIQYQILHDQLLHAVRYDSSAPSNSRANLEAHTIAGVFLSHAAVCEGIAKAFKYLCDKANLFCMLVSGSSADSQTGQIVSHAWNIVKLNDGFAHMDVTWDINVSTHSHFDRYDYFCISDEDAKLDHTYSDTPPCISSSHSYFVSKKAMISSLSGLEPFLSAKMAAQEEVIYFKLKRNGSLTRADALQIAELVEKAANKYCTNGYTYSASFNEKQNIFFFRFTYRYPRY